MPCPPHRRFPPTLRTHSIPHAAQKQMTHHVHLLIPIFPNDPQPKTCAPKDTHPSPTNKHIYRNIAPSPRESAISNAFLRVLRVAAVNLPLHSQNAHAHGNSRRTHSRIPRAPSLSPIPHPGRSPLRLGRLRERPAPLRPHWHRQNPRR